MYKDLLKNKRAIELNSKSFLDGPVVYWMRREMRVLNNWSLIFAKDLANALNKPLVVIYTSFSLTLGLEKNRLIFEIDALEEIEKELYQEGVSFQVFFEETSQKIEKSVLDFFKKINAGAVVSDFFPLKIVKKLDKKIAKEISCVFYEVDSHNIIPARVLSDKKEFAAYTIRPKVYKKINNYLEEFPRSIKLKNKKYFKLAKNDLNNKRLDIKPFDFSWLKSGEKNATTYSDNFIHKKLFTYAKNRNDPNIDGQSNLSPYLHFGMISAQKLIFDILKKTGFSIEEIVSDKKNKAKIDPNREIRDVDSTAAFFEESVVRRELSDNFCLYEDNYDNFLGFPDWAQRTLKKSESDKRQYVYKISEFENAKTHDDLWNAAQLEMIKTGKMHGYLRMYWAKKILEWTMSAEDAQKIAIYLNDKYELDGRDPNGYTGIAWSIGGVHDRAWFDRPIFGQIRYMAKSGCQKKFDVSEYVKKWI